MRIDDVARHPDPLEWLPDDTGEWGPSHFTELLRRIQELGEAFPGMAKHLAHRTLARIAVSPRRQIDDGAREALMAMCNNLCRREEAA